ncbi:MAG: phosphatase PAP2 family protein [Rhodoferax sp.]|uniref:phosphatase PAP2 family protein n=1 Tax=Rhodoferax sp. TaxID=50421 RepID=UPI001B4EFB36|nr:phosphatase PAP2 family protein [Rhodoferax sp.]MBP9905085.1 phosphatase PAP2 family protein [Rhodoferax sp.]
MSTISRLHDSPTEPSVPLRLRSWWYYTLILALPALLWDASGLDPAVMSRLADGHGFALRHNWWLERVLHDGTRQLAVVLFVGIWMMVWRPLGALKRISRRQRLEIACGITLSLLVVSAIKHYSQTSCPWDLQAYGGNAHFVSHWAWGIQDGGSGRCFPGGHASAAFAYLAFPLPWLLSSVSSQQKVGQHILLGVLLVGLLLGATQTLRGAHYPSHTLWTGLVCWLVSLANHQIFVTLGKPGVTR